MDNCFVYRVEVNMFQRFLLAEVILFVIGVSHLFCFCMVEFFLSIMPKFRDLRFFLTSFCCILLLHCNGIIWIFSNSFNLEVESRLENVLQKELNSVIWMSGGGEGGDFNISKPPFSAKSFTSSVLTDLPKKYYYYSSLN